MRDFRSIQAWGKSHELALAIYKASSSFPAEERFGLISQIRRSGVSIPSNIAEGCGRLTTAELSQFFVIAMSSASELEYQLFLAFELNYLAESDSRALNSRVVEVKKMLSTYIKRIHASRR